MCENDKNPQLSAVCVQYCLQYGKYSGEDGRIGWREIDPVLPLRTAPVCMRRYVEECGDELRSYYETDNAAPSGIERKPWDLPQQSSRWQN